MISSAVFPIQRISHNKIQKIDDYLAVEEPVEIRISFLNEQKKLTTQPLSITMRTPNPGQDIELAAGFLLTEGIIHSMEDIQKSQQIDEHIVLIELNEKIRPDLQKLERHFYTSSSCGVCGKTSIDAVKISCPVQVPVSNSMAVSPSIIYSLPISLSEKQNTFTATGGLHASALFDCKGNLISVREDVGRHNALDKLIGAAMFDGILPLQSYILLLSGRASFELIQKATMSGISFVCAVGAPSSLAVELAIERKMTLIGFLRNERFNIYCGAERVKLYGMAD